MKGNPKQSARLDRIIRDRFPSLTRRQAHEALESGLILTDRGKPWKKGDRPTPDAVIDDQKLAELLQKNRFPETTPDLSIIMEDKDYWAIDKPAGMATHPISLFDTQTVTHWAMKTDPGIDKEFPEIQPTITPHRLDIGTTGVLVVCRTRNGYEHWRSRFARKEMKKTYLAWVWGELKGEHAVDQPLAHDPKDDRKMVTLDQTHRPPMVAAQSFVKPVRTTSDKTLVEVTCHTGATHQVRVHLAYLGHPIVGDVLYDPKKRKGLNDYFLLRATELFCGEGRIEVDSEKFRSLF